MRRQLVCCSASIANSNAGTVWSAKWSVEYFHEDIRNAMILFPIFSRTYKTLLDKLQNHCFVCNWLLRVFTSLNSCYKFEKIIKF